MSLYRSCRTATVQVRGFISSSCLRVGPESPNYIDVPQSLQADLPRKLQVKGTLPVPRELFPARRKDKALAEYALAATPLPSKERTVRKDDPNAELIEWRNKMAAVRRNHLREGLRELYKRKTSTDQFIANRSEEKQATRQRVLNQPPRPDEHLTRPSIVSSMQPTRSGVLPDPDREERIARSKARVKAKELEKTAERRDSLHTLYMNSRNFITTEVQLVAEIDKAFPEGENDAWRNDHKAGDNIWNLGAPPTIQSIVTEVQRSETARWSVIQRRVKRLAEEISGGKM